MNNSRCGANVNRVWNLLDLKVVFALVVLATLLAFASCARVGHQFDITQADKLVPGVSTEDDAKNLFGEPESVSTNPQNNHQLLVLGLQSC